jgi:hypothetical protein
MPKTRKNHSSASSDYLSSSFVHEPTYHGLNKWFEYTFEKLGWMILAKRNGYDDKVMSYKNSVKRLHQAIEEKMKILKDKDRKHDLSIMKTDVETLLEHISKDFS